MLTGLVKARFPGDFRSYSKLHGGALEGLGTPFRNAKRHSAR
jgi:hypothetical protein